MLEQSGAIRLEELDGSLQKLRLMGQLVRCRGHRLGGAHVLLDNFIEALDGAVDLVRPAGLLF